MDIDCQLKDYLSIPIMSQTPDVAAVTKAENPLHQDEAVFKVRVTQEANRLKTKCKKLFTDLD